MIERDAASFLDDAASRFQSPSSEPRKPLRFGIDLGTATIVLTAVDADDRPVYWDYSVCQAIRDGVVVDFAGAIREVRALVARSNEALGVRISEAATAFPPGVPLSEARACRYVLEQSGIDCRLLLDEVSAANVVVRLADGALVDVGGGSTGVGIFRDGKLVKLGDAAGGGHHLDLIVAGALRIPIEEAEKRKRSGDDHIAGLLIPGIERIAETIRRQILGEHVASVHLVGGALLLPGAAGIISQYLGVPTVAYPHANLITPFGMALADG